MNPRIYAVIIGLILLAAARAGASECSTAGACAAIEHHSASDASKSILVDATGTPYVAGSGVPVAGPVDQAAAGTAAGAWYVRQAPAGADMSPTNPLIVQFSDGTTVYAGPTSAQLPAALVGGRLSVDGSGVTQPVSAASLPLPTGAATEATLSTVNGKLPSTVAADRTTAGAPASVRLSDGTGFVTPTTPADTQPVSAAALPLPTGAATSARQAAPGTAGTPSSEVSSVQGVVGGVAVPVSGSVTVSGTATVTQGTAAAIGAPWPVQLSDGAAALGTAGNPIRTDPTGGTAQPVSGTVTVGTLPAGSISAGATGAAGTPSAAVVSVQGVASGTVLPVSDGGGSLTVDSAQLPAALGAGGGLKVDGSGTALPVSGTVGVSGTVTVDGSGVTQPVSGTVTANAGSGTFAISAASLPLPSGAATAAKQPALGTAGTASADVITIQGIASMTPVTISGTVTSTAGAATSAGNGTTIACDTTPVVVDDSTHANTNARDVEVCNLSSNGVSIYVGGSGVTATGRELLPGACYEKRLGAGVTPLYCYAAAATSANVMEVE